MPVDTRMLAAGGVVYRRGREEALNALIQSDVAAFKAGVAELNAEQERAHGASKRNLQTKIDMANTKLQAAQDRARASLQAAKQEREAKINPFTTGRPGRRVTRRPGSRLASPRHGWRTRNSPR